MKPRDPNADVSSEAAERPDPDAGADGRSPPSGVRSYALLEPDTMALYMRFYRHTYGKSALDRRTKEFVAIAASLSSGCKNCLEGHLKKAIKHGATPEEISEVIAITLGVQAATIVDRSDLAAANLGLDRENWPTPAQDGGDEDEEDAA